CIVCGAEFTPRWRNTKLAPICSEQCKLARREARRKVIIANCKECGTAVECKGRAPSHCSLNAFNRDRVYCSVECRDARVSKRRALAMAETNRRHASARMKRNNPMLKSEAREKMSQSLRRIGH